MASIGAMWGPPTLRLLRVAMARTAQAVRQKLANANRPLQGEVQQAYARSGYTGRQPIHPIALLKQQKRGARFLSSSAVRRAEHAVKQLFSSEAETHAARHHARRFPATNVGRRIAQSGGRAPWACTLRPNLTGGAMPRTAGGYSLGGGSARYFSHGPAAPAQVVQNVSQALRAFFLSGQKLRYDGVDAAGKPLYRPVSHIEDEAMRMLTTIPRSAPGSYVDFHLTPTLTALGPLAAIAMLSGSSASGLSFQDSCTPLTPTLHADGFLDLLSADFARALKDLNLIKADLDRLSVLGDLPIDLLNGSILRVRFPGVDAATVQGLCDDIEIQRGVVSQDPDFDVFTGVPAALKFPFAPDADRTITSPGGSARSLESYHRSDEFLMSSDDESFAQDAVMEHLAENPWFSESEDEESLSPLPSYEGMEGIYRFLEECDRAKGRFG